MKNNSARVKGRKKDYFSTVGVQLTEMEDGWLRSICAQDRRNRAEEVLWLIKTYYHRGRLTIAGD